MFKEIFQNKTHLWYILIIETAIFAFFAVFIAAISDNFNYDDYALMKNIGKTFWDYANATYPWSYFPTTVHYWISYHLLGGSLIGYRIFPLISYCLTLIILVLGVRKVWSESLSLPFFLLVLFSTNNFLLQYAGYSVITFANDIFLGCTLFFVFLLEVKKSLTEKQWIFITLALLPFAFFSNIIVILPICSGIVTIIIFRYWQFRNNQSEFSVVRSIWAMKPVLFIPFLHFVISITFINQNLGIEKRPDMALLFFPSSQFSQNAGGFFQFTVTKLYTLLGGLLTPKIFYQSLTYTSPLIRLVLFSILALIISISFAYFTFSKKRDNSLIFTELFCIITLSGMILGSYFGVFPLGNPRYAGFLLIPLLVLLGHVISHWFDFFWKRLCNYHNVILIFLILLVAISGFFINYKNYNDNRVLEKENQLAVDEINQSDGDLILFSPYIEPVFSVKCPKKFADSSSMGWGSFYGHGYDGSVELLLNDRFSETNQTQKNNRILVIANNEKLITAEYPSWNEELKNNFTQIRKKQYPSLWLGYYERE